MTTIRALVLDDSAICRIRLREILESERDIMVVGEAFNGDHVVELIERNNPDVLVVDLQMPGTAGHETIEKVMAIRPLPILVVTGQPEGVRKAAVFEAIRRGALELAEKPTAGDEQAESRLRATVRQLSKIPVVRHVAGRLNSQASLATGLKLNPSTVPPPPGASNLVVGIGGSAGGPLALAALLSELPADFPASIGVVQHLPIGFTAAFQEFLQGRLKLKVKVVQGQSEMEPGVVHLAADDYHLCVTRNRRFVVSDAPHVEGHRPSVDVLFRSLAERSSMCSAGVIMSGIGKDGAAGLLEMRKNGALTIAQSSASCGVFGMPRAALETGAASLSLDPKQIAVRLMEWVEDILDNRPRPC